MNAVAAPVASHGIRFCSTTGVIEPKTGRKLAKLECLDSRGFFSGVIPRRKNFFRYQLAVVW
uniref:hypothetical protein n=1 Tax=Escherichia coli TaxID=562 RepID=UPI0020773DA8